MIRACVTFTVNIRSLVETFEDKVISSLLSLKKKKQILFRHMLTSR